MEELLKKWKQINTNYWYKIAVKQIAVKNENKWIQINRYKIAVKQGCRNCLNRLLITQGLHKNKVSLEETTVLS